MSDDKIGCAPQLVTACIALAVVIACIYAGKGHEKQKVQTNPKHKIVSHAISGKTVFVNSGTER